jgi:hypothetical protein
MSAQLTLDDQAERRAREHLGVCGPPPGGWTWRELAAALGRDMGGNWRVVPSCPGAIAASEGRRAAESARWLRQGLEKRRAKRLAAKARKEMRDARP